MIAFYHLQFRTWLLITLDKQRFMFPLASFCHRRYCLFSIKKSTLGKSTYTTIMANPNNYGATLWQIPKKDILILHKAYEMWFPSFPLNEKSFYNESKIFSAHKSENLFAPLSNQRIVSVTSPTQKFGIKVARDVRISQIRTKFSMKSFLSNICWALQYER